MDQSRWSLSRCVYYSSSTLDEMRGNLACKQPSLPPLHDAHFSTREKIEDESVRGYRSLALSVPDPL